MITILPTYINSKHVVNVFSAIIKIKVNGNWLKVYRVEILIINNVRGVY